MIKAKLFLRNFVLQDDCIIRYKKLTALIRQRKEQEVNQGEDESKQENGGEAGIDLTENATKSEN